MLRHLFYSNSRCTGTCFIVNCICSPLSLTCPLESEVTDWEDPAAMPEGAGLVTLDHWKTSDSDRKDLNSKARRLLRSKYTEITCALVFLSFVFTAFPGVLVSSLFFFLVLE